MTIFGQGFIKAHLYRVRHIFYLGTALNVFCVSGMLVLVFHPMLARSILVKGLDLLEKMHLMKKKSSRLEKLNASMDQYRATAVYLREHVWVLVEVFAITVFQRYLQRYSCLSEDTSESDREYHCDHICTENGNVCSNMVCI